MWMFFTLLLILMSAAVAVAIVHVYRRRRQRKLFRPLTPANGTIRPAIAMRAAAPRLDSRWRAGAVCFVTGMPMPACACGNCRGGRQ
jgi:hypothetical protein